MNKMMKYEEFIEEKKSKIAEIMGHGFNYFPNNIWTYCLDKNWYGRKTYLTIYFNNEIVEKIRIVKSFKKI